MRRRISAFEWRARTLDEWCADVQNRGIESLAAWAVVDRTSYNYARALGVHRDVASTLGWQSRLSNGSLRHLSDQDFAERFIAAGARSASDLWRINNAWCAILRREGRLDRVRHLVGARYLTERHEPTLEYFVHRCDAFDFFDAWTVVDRSAVQTARRLGLLGAVRGATKPRPATFDTLGGPVRGLSELVVARLLEYNRVPFVTQPEYPFDVPGRKYHAMRADFRLGSGWWIEVWSMPLRAGGDWDVGLRYTQRRRLKTDLCRRYGLSLIPVEGSLLRRSRIVVFVEHVAIAFGPACHLDVSGIESGKLLSTEPIRDEPADGSSGRD